MKPLLSLCSLAVCLCAVNSKAQLFDDFNDGVINNALWTTSLPFGYSQVYETGGRAVMIGRGGLNTVQALPVSIEITGRFKFTGQEDHFGITMRSDLVFANSYQEKYGVRVSFQDNSQSLRITEYNTDNSITELAFLSYPLAVNTDYDFRITDDGNNIRLYMMGSSTPAIQGSSLFRAGDKVSIFNREFSISQSQLDYISIVPEPTSLAFLGCFGLVALWKRKR